MKKIIVNKIRCKKCGEVIESKSRHDFVTCKCGSCSVDGGLNYIRRCANSLDDYEELSEFENVLTELIKRFCKENEEKYSYYEKYSGRGMFGRTCSGVVVKNGYSYMQMLMELTKFLDEKEFDDADLELEGVSTDSLGMDTIVYFPKIES